MSAQTLAVSTASTTNGTSYASGAFTPVASDWLIALVFSSDTLAAAPTLAASANGITFTRHGTVAQKGTTDQIYVFAADQLLGATPASMTVTFTCTADAATGCVIVVIRVSGMTKTGLAAIRQLAVSSNNAGGTAPAPSFGAGNNALTANAMLMGVLCTTAAPLATPNAGWTEQVDTSYATPTTGAYLETRDSGFTATSLTFSTGTLGNNCGVLIELDTSSVTDKSSSDSATGTDAATLATALSSADTAAGTDASSLAATLSSADSGTGTDAQTSSASITSSDAATGSEAVGDRTMAAADSATGTDATGARELTAADAGAGSDAASLSAALSGSDSASGTDASPTLSAALSSTDSAAGSDAATDRGLTGTDAATGTDAQSLAAAITSADSASSSEAIGPRALASQDSATGTDQLLLLDQGATPISSADSAVGTEMESLSVELTSSDSATGTEALGARSLAAADSATGSDDATLGADLSGSDSATGTDAQSSSAALSAADVATGSDAQTLSAQLQDADQASGVELAALEAMLAAFDAALGSEAVTDRELTAHDSATGSDSSGSVQQPRDETTLPGPHRTRPADQIQGPSAVEDTTGPSGVSHTEQTGPHVT